MMRRWSLFRFFLPALVSIVLVLAIPASPCRAGVVINEVYYDHPGRDEGWEFVEIVNGGDEAADLTGWSLETIDGSTLRRTVVWRAGAGLRIDPGQILCVAGSARGPAPGLILGGSLGNGPDAVRLVSPAGAADLVGYGECASSELSESTPAEDVPPGSSLARKPDGADTDQNGIDFVRAAPTPGRRNFFERDVALRFGAREMLPCRGAGFTCGLVVENRGLTPFAGDVTVVAEVREDGSLVSTGRSVRALSLAPGAADSAETAMAAAPAERFMVSAHLAGSPDDNPLNDTVIVAVGSSPGPVVVSEIMYRPREGRSEWIELENRSGADLNLRSFFVGDATGSKHLITSQDFVVAPGSFAIIAKDSAAFVREFPSCAAPVRSPAGGWPSLNDTDRGDQADAVELHDADVLLVERVSYRDLLDEERGRSIERISAEACGDRPGGLWHRCAARGGATPGAANSTRVERLPPRSAVEVSPNPFSPARDGETAITGRCNPGETGFLVRVFDLNGGEIKRVYGESGGAREFSCRWNGRAGDGSRVGTGLYVCCVEFVGRGGGVCRREKRVIAVAGD